MMQIHGQKPTMKLTSNIPHIELEFVLHEGFDVETLSRDDVLRCPIVLGEVVCQNGVHHDCFCPSKQF